MEILQLKDIACYLPYGLNVIIDCAESIYLNYSQVLIKGTRTIKLNCSYLSLLENNSINIETKIENYKTGKVSTIWHKSNRLLIPILRPISDLYKPLKDGTIPIVELAKIAFPEYKDWALDDKYIFTTKKSGMSITFRFRENHHSFVSNTGVNEYQMQLFDYLNEHHFDYRGLIEKGLAIDINAI